MTPDLSDRDRERFAALHERLQDVDRADRTGTRDVAPGPIDPMLASTFRGELEGFSEDGWLAERKFDGTRIIVQKFDGRVALYTRRHIDRAETLAELTAHCEAVLPDGIILDGEYCFLTPDGVSQFRPIHQSPEETNHGELTEQYVVFDVLAVSGSWCLRDTLDRRKERLAAAVDSDAWIRPVDPVYADFSAFYAEMIDRDEEGIMLKRRSSPYHPGVRSDHWRKVKSFTEADFLAVGYTAGSGSRADTFGALVLTDGAKYVGRVGSGFDRASLADLHAEMTPIEDYPVSPNAVGDAYTPIEPLVVRVKFQEVTADGKLRAPVYLGRRTEKPLEQVTPLDTG